MIEFLHSGHNDTVSAHSGDDLGYWLYYFVIVPALDGHIEEEASEYISVDDEAKKITSYVLDNYGEDIFAICGLSMGGAITYKIFESRRLNIQNVIMDGAPLLPLGKLPIWFMTKSYISIVHKSKKRDDKVIESCELLVN